MNAHAADSGKNYLNETYGLKSWLLTVDHKRIGIMYLLTLTGFFILGGIFASLIRIELLTKATCLKPKHIIGCSQCMA